MKQGIIFDLDGVLLSTDEMHYAAWKSVADELGVPFDRQVNNLLRGVSRMDSLNIILSHGGLTLSDEEKEAVAARKNERYRAGLQTLTPDAVAPQVRQTLAALKERGLKLAVGSSSRNTRLILEKTDLGRFFDAVSDGTNITRPKPDDCAVVEDAVAGIDAAKAGGFLSIGIGDAAGYAKTDYPIRSLRDLLDLF